MRIYGMLLEAAVSEHVLEEARVSTRKPVETLGVESDWGGWG